MAFTDLPTLPQLPTTPCANAGGSQVPAPAAARGRPRPSPILGGGVKTTEFWISVVAVVLPPLLGSLEPGLQGWARSSGWVGGLVAVMYTAARSYLKVTTVKANAM